MAALGSWPSRPAPLAPMLHNAHQSNGMSHQHASNTSNRRVAAPISSLGHGSFASPTESEFSEGCDDQEWVRDWDEDRVGEWLRGISCHQYVKLFRDNNITGENLLDMDQTHLKDMGIKKIGDRVRIGSQAKLFRSRTYQRPSKRAVIRESLIALENPIYTPSSSSSPQPLNSARSAKTSRSEKRLSRQMNASDLTHMTMSSIPTKASSRSGSPHFDKENRATRGPRYAASPMENTAREQGSSYFNGSTSSGRTATTPGDMPQTARYVGQARAIGIPMDNPQVGRFNNRLRESPNHDNSVTNSTTLPADKPLIRVIYDSGRSSVVSVEGCKTAEEIILRTLKKGNLNEAHVKSYCFYVLDGIEPNPVYCRRLPDAELVRVASERARSERSRLILRKIHTGEPEEEQLRTAANIALQQRQQTQPPPAAAGKSSSRSQLKVERLTGESLAAVSYPIPPTSLADRERHVNFAAHDMERADSVSTTISTRAKKLKDFYGARPPSELITSDLTSYFPDFEREEIERTVRMSIRRSQRLSRATSRLSTASNLSFLSSLKDAPPLPAISDAWLNGATRSIRPLSIVRLGRPPIYRESVASTILEPLDEESPLEPDRKSYVSFGAESGSDTNIAVTDPEGNTTSHGYFDDTGESAPNTEASGSLNDQLSQALAEDGEENDEELTDFLKSDSWENIKYMKGTLIGQGSFGSVYLALHAVTGELMAVKQVEIPSYSGTALDAKKNNMLEALKHEIGLLRDLKHPNIVQYLGSSTDDTHLNIFLEYVPGGSVATMLINYGPLGEGLIRNFVRQILVGLAYLHSRDIIHRDIKGANILVDNKGFVKISDFGISKRVEASTYLNVSKKGNHRVSLQGSVFWMAPEVVRQTTYTRKADIWSLGCLIVEMFTGTHPHPNCTQMMAIFKIGSSPDASPTIPDNAGEDARAFLRRTFELDHEKRPTADELLLSDFCNMKA